MGLVAGGGAGASGAAGERKAWLALLKVLRAKFTGLQFTKQCRKTWERIFWDLTQ